MGKFGDLLRTGRDIIDDLHTSKEEKLEKEIQRLKIQADINRQEAQHRSVFVAGWRPFIGWVCGSGLAWAFIIHPLLTWAMAIWWADMEPPPTIEVGQLIALLGGMLGLGGMRSWEKNKKLAK